MNAPLATLRLSSCESRCNASRAERARPSWRLRTMAKSSVKTWKRTLGKVLFSASSTSGGSLATVTPGFWAMTISPCWPNAHLPGVCLGVSLRTCS